VTAPEPIPAPGGRTRDVREEIARIAVGFFGGGGLSARADAEHLADAVLACPTVADALAAVERVRALHQPLDRGTGPHCQGCATYVTYTDWPCATIRALRGAADA
jgi:hypothetical protein